MKDYRHKRQRREGRVDTLAWSAGQSREGEVWEGDKAAEAR